MWSTAALTASSPSDMLPPFGGMAPFPLRADAYSASLPCLMRGAQAALSPNLGAPATPAAWHTLQVVSWAALPPAGPAALAGAAPPPAAAPSAGAAAATGAGGGGI